MSDKTRTIFAHAGYRREDYVFARTQSRALSARDWESRGRPLQSWSDYLYPALGLTGAAVIILEALH